jgi:protein TonB
MFEQTLVNKPETAREPYSMLLSLILQIVVLGVLCLMPFVFTQVLPSIELKNVLAAPPKPPVALQARATASARSASVPNRSLRLDALSVRFTNRPIAAQNQTFPEAPSVGGDILVGQGDGVIGSIIGTVPVPPPMPVASVKPPVQKPIRVGSISGANIIHMVQPSYPAIARMNHIQGAVEFTATISKEGGIENLTLLRGHPLLVNAARDAVLQWRYRPTMLNGEPVEVITDIVVNFALNQ